MRTTNSASPSSDFGALDFGALPEGQRFGLVPAWALALSGLKPGPKALYASFCANADAHGHLWRGVTRVAGEFAVSRRQVERWLNDLEAAGVLVRFTHKSKPRYLVIRDPAGRAWAQRTNLARVVKRRAASPGNRARNADETVSETLSETGAQKVSEKVSETRAHPAAATSMSQANDTDVAGDATPMSSKQYLLNKPPLTTREQTPEQETEKLAGAKRAATPSRRRPVGLKTFGSNLGHAAFIQDRLNSLASEVGGWERLAGFTSAQQVELLAARCGAEVTKAEVEAALGVGR